MVNETHETELSRPIKVKALPADPVVIEADAGERAGLAERFGLPGIDRLRAVVGIAPSGPGFRVTGTLEAAIRQTCAISGEDFPAKIVEDVDLRFVREQANAGVVNEDGEIEIDLDLNDSDEIEFSGDSFDLGEATAQTLGLAIDPYAEGPNAENAREKAGIVGEGEQQGPLAEALKGLKSG